MLRPKGCALWTPFPLPITPPGAIGDLERAVFCYRIAHEKPPGASIDSSFLTAQRDLFESGLVAEIGPNAFAVWMALKHHADFSTGRAFPGVRRLAELVGLNKDTVSKCIHALEDARLLRSTPKGRGKAYVARERLDVRIGNAVVCSVLVDYVPSRLREKLIGIEHALESGQGLSGEAFTDVEIIPGPGFEWDENSRSLKGKIPTRALATDGRQEFKTALEHLRKK